MSECSADPICSSDWDRGVPYEGRDKQSHDFSPTAWQLQVSFRGSKHTQFFILHPLGRYLGDLR
jgi:hypothetical protein